MTDTRTRSSAPLAAAWLVTALVVAPVGFLLFALSEGDGDRALGLALAISGVLASLGPLSTILLSRLVLGERLQLTQRLGVGLAVAAVSCVALA